METIAAFGRMVTRREAQEIVVNDLVAEICHAGMEEVLRNLLTNGWTPLDEWTDQELEEFLAGLCEDNQPGR